MKYWLGVLFVFFVVVLVRLMDDMDRQRKPYRQFSEPIEYVCNTYRFESIIDPKFPLNTAVYVDLTALCGEVFVPANIDSYVVRIDDGTRALLVDGQQKDRIIGVLASHGLDWECDFDSGRLEITSYSPTNGLQSDGDILCLFEE